MKRTINKTYHVLIVDDEPLILHLLRNVLNDISDSDAGINFKITAVNNSDDALYEVRKAVNSKPFDLVLLDISIPCSRDKTILSGEDLGIEIISFFPDVKIIVLTNQSDNFRLNNILKSLNPDGFIIKTDIDLPDLIGGIKTVLQDIPYYSKAILQLMRKHIVNDFTLDKIDRQLLYQISKGARTKELIEITRLSKSAIEFRKRNLKTVFGIDQGSDRKLIIRAEQHGFI